MCTYVRMYSVCDGGCNHHLKSCDLFFFCVRLSLTTNCPLERIWLAHIIAHTLLLHCVRVYRRSSSRVMFVCFTHLFLLCYVCVYHTSSPLVWCLYVRTYTTHSPLMLYLCASIPHTLLSHCVKVSSVPTSLCAGADGGQH